MAQPNQPASNHNIRNPDKVKTPVPVEPVNTPQEQREHLAGPLTQTATPEGTPPRDAFDASSILRVDSLNSQAVALKRLNAAQGHQAAAHITTTQGNRHLNKVVASLKVQPKLTVGEPDDQYEKEADQVADQVMRIVGPPPPPTGKDESTPGIQLLPSPLPGGD